MQAPTELAQQLECLRRDGAVVVPSVYPAPLLAQVRGHYLAAWAELEAELPSLVWRRRRYHSRKRMHFLYNALYDNKLVDGDRLAVDCNVPITSLRERRRRFRWQCGLWRCFYPESIKS